MQLRRVAACTGALKACRLVFQVGNGLQSKLALLGNSGKKARPRQSNMVIGQAFVGQRPASRPLEKGCAPPARRPGPSDL